MVVISRVAEDPQPGVAVAREDEPIVVTTAVTFVVPAGLDDLDTPEVVSVGIDVVTDFLDPFPPELDDAESARVVRDIGKVLFRVGRDFVDRQVAETFGSGSV